MLSVSKPTLNWTGHHAIVVGLHNPLPLSITVRNEGDGTLNWSVTADNDQPGRYMRMVSATGTAACKGGENERLSCTGSDTATIVLSFTSWWSGLGSPGDYTTNLTIRNTDKPDESVVVPVTLSVVAAAVRPVFSYAGSPIDCRNTHQKFGADVDTCNVADERPPGPGAPVPAVGGTYKDPTFGSTVRVITPPRQIHAYASVSAFNSDGTMAVVSNMSGMGRVVNTTTGDVIAENIPGSDVWRLWSSVSPNAYYHTGRSPGTVLYRYTVNAGDQRLRDFSDLTNGQPITTGGQGDLSKDEWVAFYSDKAKVVCAYDIPNDWAYCTSYGHIQPAITPNYALISKGVDSATGKRYVILAGLPATFVFTVDPERRTLDLDTVGPNHLGTDHRLLVDWNPDNGCVPSAGRCLSQAHDDTVEDANGIQYLVQAPYYESPNAIGLVAFQLNTGKLMTLPIELGGGMHLIYWYQPGSGVSMLTMNHVGCARNAPYCVLTTGKAAPGGAGQGATVSQVITGATNEENIRITTRQPHKYTPGTPVNIGGVAGNTAANGIWTVVSVIDANNFTISADGRSSGVFVAGYATVGPAGPMKRSAYDGEVIVFAVGPRDPMMRRVAFHRSVYYSMEDGTGFGYYAIPRGCISHDAKQVLYSSNFGEPTQFRVVTAETGLWSGPNAHVQALGSEALIAYRSGRGDVCTREISNTHTFANASASADDGDGLLRFWHITDLNKKKNYYWRISCQETSLRGSLQTNDAGPVEGGPVSLRLMPSESGAESVRVRWGYTPEMQEEPVVAPCAGGCSVDIPAARQRVVYVHWVWRDAAEATVGEGRTSLVLGAADSELSLKP